MLVKDVPILDLLRNRVIVSHGCIKAARTKETRRTSEHRLKCYQQAIGWIRLADLTEDKPKELAEKAPEIVMNFSDEVYHAKASNPKHRR